MTMKTKTKQKVKKNPNEYNEKKEKKSFKTTPIQYSGGVDFFVRSFRFLSSSSSLKSVRSYMIQA
ncbi:hypothetical protein DERP_001039 [Dermatophagoides pteronyssinus]|uniref:Uncharacterized protein n=1 Tax=Dermatophagoides pteronyssinus TaxID=6956 RepID=A0ABQ8JDV6_DERPT|nr:hypothetical protein DERP_001039 [Dermatophagoides pteronyssinus]